MKFLSALIFYSLSFLTSNTTDMIELLKSFIKDKDEDKVVSLIIENPEMLDLNDENGSSGLMIIAYSGFERAIRQAVELKETFTFHEAIVSGQYSIVKDSLNHSNADMANTYSVDGFTPLSLASFFNQTEIAELLVSSGADPNLSAKNASKVNALHSAVAKENIQLCKLYIQQGVEVNSVQTQNVTALHSAVHRGNLELTQLLVENGASINLEMDNGDTAITIAQREGYSDILKYLKDKNR